MKKFSIVLTLAAFLLSACGGGGSSGSNGGPSSGKVIITLPASIEPSKSSPDEIKSFSGTKDGSDIYYTVYLSSNDTEFEAEEEGEPGDTIVIGNIPEGKYTLVVKAKDSGTGTVLNDITINVDIAVDKAVIADVKVKEDGSLKIDISIETPESDPELIGTWQIVSEKIGDETPNDIENGEEKTEEIDGTEVSFTVITYVKVTETEIKKYMKILKSTNIALLPNGTYFCEDEDSSYIIINGTIDGETAYSVNQDQLTLSFTDENEEDGEVEIELVFKRVTNSALAGATHNPLACDDEDDDDDDDEDNYAYVMVENTSSSTAIHVSLSNRYVYGDVAPGTSTDYYKFYCNDNNSGHCDGGTMDIEEVLPESNMSVSFELTQLNKGGYYKIQIRSDLEKIKCFQQYLLNENEPPELMKEDCTVINEISPVCKAWEDGGKINNAAGFAGGAGTTGNPYIICSANHLNNVRNNLASHYALKNNIDLSDYSSWVPIGTTDNAFTGSLVGDKVNVNGVEKAVYAIENFTIDNYNVSTQGLFTQITNGKVENIIFAKVSISNGSDAGTLCYYLSSSTVKNCHVKHGLLRYSVIKGKDSAAGLVNISYISIIENCSVSAQISGSDNVGGIVSILYGDRYTSKSIIKNCHVDADVDAYNSYGGGVAAKMEDAIIENVTFTGRVTVGGFYTGYYAAGIAAEAIFGSKISNVFVTGTIQADKYIGGICANILGGDPAEGLEKCSISNAYVNAELTSMFEQENVNYLESIYIGGLVGNVGADTDIDTSYYTGNIFFWGRKNNDEAKLCTGGLYGRYWDDGFNSSLNCYWNKEKSGLSNANGIGSGAGTGLSDNQMKNLSNFTGFNTAVWAQDNAINNGYPYQKAHLNILQEMIY